MGKGPRVGSPSTGGEWGKCSKRCWSVVLRFDHVLRSPAMTLEIVKPTEPLAVQLG